MLLILLLGPSLPASCEYAKMITSPSGNGAIYLGSGCKTISNDLHDNDIYEMKILSNGTMKWGSINHKLKFKRELPVMDYIDESKVNCFPKTTTVTPTTIHTTVTTSGNLLLKMLIVYFIEVSITYPIDAFKIQHPQPPLQIYQQQLQ